LSAATRPSRRISVTAGTEARISSGTADRTSRSLKERQVGRAHRDFLEEPVESRNLPVDVDVHPTGVRADEASPLERGRPVIGEGTEADS